MTARPHPGKGRQCPIHWHSLHASTPLQSAAAPPQSKAPEGSVGFNRGLSAMNVSQVLLLPLGAARAVGRCWQRWFSPGGFLRAQDLLCPWTHDLGNATFLPVLLRPKLFKLPVLWGRNYSSIKHPACVGYYLDMLL